MTNQEWLCSLSPGEFLNRIKWLLLNYGKRWTDSDPAIIEWLQGKHEVNTPEDNGMTREEAIEQLYNILFNNYRSAEKDKEALNMAIQALEQEPKTGHWITISHGFPAEPTSVCSECGFDRDFYIRTRGFDKIKYCPNCGCRMIEPQESEG